MRDLKLSTEPDAFGIIYGWAERNGERVRANILPPEHSNAKAFIWEVRKLWHRWGRRWIGTTG